MKTETGNGRCTGARSFGHNACPVLRRMMVRPQGEFYNCPNLGLKYVRICQNWEVRAVSESAEPGYGRQKIIRLFEFLINFLMPRINSILTICSVENHHF